MTSHTLRRSPPPAALTPEIRWSLLRAFGPARAPFLEPVDGPRAAAVARELGLVERIGARVPASILVGELGREVAQQLALSRLQVLAKVRGLCELIPELASAATDADIPVVFLKFAALHVGGHLVEGSRAAGDIDVLMPERDVERAVAMLTSRGFFAAETTLADHHHAPPLRDRQGRVVELHTRLPGLREPGARRFAGFEALESRGGLEPARGLGRGCHVLRRELMVAYAVAHGLAQHGGADVYPVTRVLADVIDLLPDERRTKGMGALEWIAADVPTSELEAVLALCDALEQGDVHGLETGLAPRRESALLHHVLASALDPDYRRGLASVHVLGSLSDEPRAWRFLKTVQCLVLPSKAQLAARLGLPSARLVTPRLRLAHVVSLAGRLPGLARAALRTAWGAKLARRVRGT